MAATLKEAVWPAVTVWLAGWVVIERPADVLKEWPPLCPWLPFESVELTW